MQRTQTAKLVLMCALLAALCLFSGARQAFCQQTPTSTQTQETEEQRRTKLVEALERAQEEVKASRKYIPQLEASVKSKQSIIDAQKQKQTLSDEAILSLQKEVADTKAIIESQKLTISQDKTEIDYLKKELDKTNKKLAHARKLEKYLIVGLGAFILTTILK